MSCLGLWRHGLPVNDQLAFSLADDSTEPVRSCESCISRLSCRASFHELRFAPGFLSSHIYMFIQQRTSSAGRTRRSDDCRTHDLDSVTWAPRAERLDESTVMLILSPVHGLWIVGKPCPLIDGHRPIVVCHRSVSSQSPHWEVTTGDHTVCPQSGCDLGVGVVLFWTHFCWACRHDGTTAGLKLHQQFYSWNLVKKMWPQINDLTLLSNSGHQKRTDFMHRHMGCTAVCFNLWYLQCHCMHAPSVGHRSLNDFMLPWLLLLKQWTKPRLAPYVASNNSVSDGSQESRA